MQPPIDLVIFVGLPGAGKTTFFRERFSATHAHVSRDVAGRAGHSQGGRALEIGRLLREGRSVVVDDTNVRARDRAPLIAAAHAAGARVVGYYFDVTTRAAVARNAQRTGAARVPKVAIFTSAKRLEPPTPAEGFDQLHVVRLAPDGRAFVEDDPDTPPG